MCIINDGSIIERVFTKQVSDDYFCNNFDSSELKKEDNFEDVLENVSDDYVVNSK